MKVYVLMQGNVYYRRVLDVTGMAYIACDHFVLADLFATIDGAEAVRKIYNLTDVVIVEVDVQIGKVVA